MAQEEDTTRKRDALAIVCCGRLQEAGTWLHSNSNQLWARNVPTSSSSDSAMACLIYLLLRKQNTQPNRGKKNKPFIKVEFTCIAAAAAAAAATTK